MENTENDSPSDTTIVTEKYIYKCKQWPYTTELMLNFNRHESSYCGKHLERNKVIHRCKEKSSIL